MPRTRALSALLGSAWLLASVQAFAATPLPRRVLAAQPLPAPLVTAPVAARTAKWEMCEPLVVEEDTHTPEEKLEGSLLMFAVAILWGSNFPAVKNIMESGLSAPAAAALRFTIAAIALLPLLRGKPLPRDLVLGGLECGCWLALGYVAQALALHDAQAGVVAFIASLQVVFVPAVLTAFGHPATVKLIVAAGLCVAGVGFLELGAAENTATSVSAQLLAILQPIGFGTSYLRIEAVMKRHPDSSLQLSSLQLLSNALISLIWFGIQAQFYGQGIDMNVLTEPAVIGGLVWTALISTALTVLLQTRALSKLPASDSSVIVATEPLWAAVFASFLLGETLDATEMLGGLLILSGCLSNTILPDSFDRSFTSLFTSTSAPSDIPPDYPDEGSRNDTTNDAKGVVPMSPDTVEIRQQNGVRFSPQMESLSKKLDDQSRLVNSAADIDP